MFQMGKEQKLRHLLPNHSVCLTPPPRLPTLRISSCPPSLPPLRRSSGLLSPSLPPPLLWIRRSFSRHPQLLLLPHLILLSSPSWSALCLRSGGCRTRASTRVLFVSPGQRTAASSTDELDTWCLVTSVPGSWRKGISCVRSAGCPSSPSSSPTSAKTHLFSHFHVLLDNSKLNVQIHFSAFVHRHMLALSLCLCCSPWCPKEF